jgi:hypothetical protein
VKIKITTDGLGESRWYEYVVRFVFGGIVTALAGIIAKRFGAEIGGLFLAFPAIFPATATLIEKHEKRKKEEAGQEGTGRGRAAAGVDAAGAAMGTLGLAVFAVIVWQGLPQLKLAVVLTMATVAWLVTSVGVWQLRESLWRRLRRYRLHAHNPGLSTPLCASQARKKESR